LAGDYYMQAKISAERRGRRGKKTEERKDAVGELKNRRPKSFIN
jgi:hypothetical protein